MKHRLTYSNAPPQCRGVTPEKCWQQSAVGSRQSADRIGKTEDRSQKTKVESWQLVIGSRKTEVGRVYRIAGGARAVSAKVTVTVMLFRPTGRDGPVLTALSGSTEPIMLICGVPAWLEEEGRGEGKGRGQPLKARGQPPAARGKPPKARDRGHPPEVEYNGFHRVKLPEMGEVCDLSACDLSAFAEPARLCHSGGPDNVNVERIKRSVNVGSGKRDRDRIINAVKSGDVDRLKDDLEWNMNMKNNKVCKMNN